MRSRIAEIHTGHFEASRLNDTGPALAIVGTYFDANEDRLNSFRLDRKSDSFYELDATTGSEDPTYLAFHPNDEYMYAENETHLGMVQAYNVDAETGTLT